MAHRGGERVKKFQDNMALVRILQNDTKGHKMPFLVNFINTGPILPRWYVLSIPSVCVGGERGGIVSLHLHPNLRMGSMETTDGVKLTLYICIWQQRPKKNAHTEVNCEPGLRKTYACENLTVYSFHMWVEHVVMPWFVYISIGFRVWQGADFTEPTTSRRRRWPLRFWTSR